MYSFDATLHARDPATVDGPVVTLQGMQVRTLCPPQNVAQPGLGRSFEEVAAALESLPRLHVEPDGSFVWVGNEPQPWQVDGIIYDRAGQVAFVELHGNCPAEEFDRLLTSCGWPQRQIIFQLRQAGVFISESEFRRHGART